jgi:hypothetical protein
LTRIETYEKDRCILLPEDHQDNVKTSAPAGIRHEEGCTSHPCGHKSTSPRSLQKASSHLRLSCVVCYVVTAEGCINMSCCLAMPLSHITIIIILLYNIISSKVKIMNYVADL